MIVCRVVQFLPANASPEAVGILDTNWYGVANVDCLPNDVARLIGVFWIKESEFYIPAIRTRSTVLARSQLDGFELQWCHPLLSNVHEQIVSVLRQEILQLHGSKVDRPIA